MKSVFIDTNVYLRIFGKTSDTLNEIEVLLELVKSDDLNLFTTEQVQEEYFRNVEAEIDQAVRLVGAVPEKVELPRITQEFTQANDILGLVSDMRTKKKELLEAVRSAIENDELRTDAFVNKLFKNSTSVNRSEKVIEAARLRSDLGNPPGKIDSLGDQINWESLLHEVEDGDLILISTDGDFSYKHHPDKPRKFLATEWAAHKGGELKLYNDLKTFLTSEFPDATDAKRVAIETTLKRFERSKSFLRTHAQIAILREHQKDLTWDDAYRAFRAFIDNSQVKWLAFDEDVQDFYERLHAEFFSDTSIELDNELYEVAPYLDPNATEPPF